MRDARMSAETAAREPRRCVAYYRVSTKRQGASGLGLEAQRAAVESFLRSGQCTELVAEFTEVESGKRDDRPQLERALKAARTRRARLVVAKLDRLSRKAAHIFRLIDEEDVDFVVVDMPNATREVLGIMASVAEGEGDRISARTRAALAAARDRGVELGGRRATTWDEEVPREVITKSKATRTARADRFAEDLREDIEELRESGTTSLRALACGLNERGCRTPRGSEWTAGAVRRVLQRLEGLRTPS
jgi:DNA invertase Pin-like site-specific DNA recombinase